MMRCEIVDRKKDSVSLRMVFDSDTFEEAVVHAYRERYPDDVKRPELMMCSIAGVLERCDSALDVVRAAVQSLFSAHCDEAFARLGLVFGSSVEMRPISSELGEPLALAVQARGVCDVADLTYEALEVSYDKLVVQGDEVDERLARARERYGVRTDEELLGKVKAYASVAEMRAAISESLERYVAQANAAARRDALARALCARNPVSVSAQEQDAFVSGEIEKLKGQLGPDEFARQGFDEESLRKAVRRDSGHIPALNRILDAIAAQKGFGVTDQDRRKEVASVRAQSVKPDNLEEVEETLRALQGNKAARDALDAAVKRSKALDYVMTRTAFKTRALLSLAEVAPTQALFG